MELGPEQTGLSIDHHSQAAKADAEIGEEAEF
jgi:hypothetical protein